MRGGPSLNNLVIIFGDAPVLKLVSSSRSLTSISAGFTVDVGTEDTPDDELVLFITDRYSQIKRGEL